MMLRGLIAAIFLLMVSSNTLRAQDLQNIKAKEDNIARYQALESQYSNAGPVEKKDKAKTKTSDKAEVQKQYSTVKKAYAFNPAWKNTRQLSGENDDTSDIRYFSFQNYHNAISLGFESESEMRRIASSSVPANRNRLLFEENLETDFKGSIYHPNLASFDINLKNGIRQRKEKFQAYSTSKLRNSYLNQFHITGSFLRKKPYAFSLSADKSRAVENSDFFERQIVYSDRYAGNFGYKNKFVPVNLSLSDSSKSIDRLSRPSQKFDDREINLVLSNESHVTGTTRFGGTIDRFSRKESDVDGWTGISKDFSLTNQKSLTEDKNKWLYSSLHYYDVTGLSENNILNLNEELNMDYTDYLTNSFTYNFSDRSSSGVGARDNRLSTLLRHRLFESLISSLNAYLFREAATEFSQDSYGLSIDENYSKRLGETGRFSMGAGVSYSDERRTVPGGIISVIDEPHTLTIGIITLLGKPRVNTSTIVVTDNTGTITYVLNTDYQLGSFGDYTQILRLAGGAIADGQGVLVDYQAKSNPSLRFNTLGENFHSRIDLFSNAIGVYYRISNEAHPSIAGEENIVLQTLTDTTIGVDHNYKNLRIAVEYEHYDSSLSPYRQLRLNESFFFNPTEYSILRFESSQTAVRLGGDNKLQEFYDYLNTYSIRLNNYSQFNAEAGVRLQKGYGINLNDMVAGANFEVRLAKFQLNVRYDFKKQLYINDILINHFFSLRVKREF